MIVFQETGTLYQKRYPRVFPFGFNHLLAVLFCIGLSLGVTIAVGILLYFQVCIFLHALSQAAKALGSPVVA